MRRGAALLAVLVAVTALAACRTPGGPGGGGPGHGGGPGGLGTGNGWVDRREWRAAQDGYLAFATEELTPSSPTNVLAHLTRAERDRRFAFDADAIGPDDFAAVFEKIDAFRDTSDFDLLQLVALWEGHRRRPRARPADRHRAALHRRSATGTPTRCPPASSTTSGSGARTTASSSTRSSTWPAGRCPTPRSRSRASRDAPTPTAGRARIEAWLDEKAAHGFSEWHSDVYYQEDIQALTLLAEHGERDLARRAAAMLDLFLYDLAVHQLQGNNGVTHGRSYMKDKSRADRPGRVRR